MQVPWILRAAAHSWQGLGEDQARHDQPLISDMMLVMPKQKLAWKTKPDQGDYESAQPYLSLVFRAPQATALVKALHKAPINSARQKICCAPAAFRYCPKARRAYGTT